MTTTLDIVLLVHDTASWADLAIRAIEHHTTVPYRLYIVDSASKEQKTLDMLAEAEKRGHTVIHLAENRSFSNGMNVGVSAGSSRFVALVNSDALVTENWDRALIQDASDKFTGLVGARSNYVAGAQGDPSWTGEPPFIAFVCVAFRRQVWDIVGPLDEENFTGFSSEDLDWSIRVKKAGLKLKVSGAYVLHAGSRTLTAQVGDAAARAANDAKYNRVLEEKWGRETVQNLTKMRGSGLIVSYHAEEHTRVKFMEHVLMLKRADGIGFNYLHVTRHHIASARNAAAKLAMDHNYDWLIQLDDDATFPSDLVRRLISHQKDIVTALAYQRKPPHWPCVFEIGPDGMMGAPMMGIEHTGLRKVDASGFHCSVTRTSVYRKLLEAGIKEFYGGFENKVGEDFAFSLNCKKAGIQIYCDTELIAGHIGDPINVDEGYVKAFRAQQG